MVNILKKTNDFVDYLFAFAFFILFLVGIYALYDTWHVYNVTQDKSVLKYKPTKQNAEVVLQELSDDAVAWITVDGTNIDYPVMQGKDNSEYLNKDPYGNYALSGSIFLDSRNAHDFTDDYSLIYGHHMEYGMMFGSLDDFQDKEYFDSHRTGELVVGDREYTIHFFAFLDVDAMEREIFNPETDVKNKLDFIYEKAGIYYEPEDERLIALSTCKYPETKDRFVLVGTLIENKKE